MWETFFLAILARVVRPRERNAEARRRDQQSGREAVATLAGVLVLAVTTRLLGPSLVIASAVRVFGHLARLAAQRGIDQKHEQPPAGFPFQEVLPQRTVDIELAIAGTPQKPRDLRPMPGLAANAPRGLQARHPPPVQDER